MKKRDFETYQKRFRDFKILPKFSKTHVFQGTILHPFMIIKTISKFLGQLREMTHWKYRQLCFQSNPGKFTTCMSPAILLSR